MKWRAMFFFVSTTDPERVVFTCEALDSKYGRYNNALIVAENIVLRKNHYSK